MSQVSGINISKHKNPQYPYNKLTNTILYRQTFDWKIMNVNQCSPKQIYDYFKWPNSSACEISQDFGGLMLGPPTSMIDGQKAVCFDPPVRPPPGDCLVYSFGVGGDWSF